MKKVVLTTSNSDEYYRKIFNQGGFALEYSAVWKPNYVYPQIDKIIYNMKDIRKPATIVYWKDGTKTVVVCNNGNGDAFTKEMGVAMCYIRKIMPNRSEFLRLVENGFEQH